MDKEIRIEKPRLAEREAKNPTMPDIAQKLREYSKEELSGVLSMTINALLTDRLQTEMYFRLSDEALTAARNQEQIDKTHSDKKKMEELIVSIDDKLRVLRQIKAEIEDGRLKI